MLMVATILNTSCSSKKVAQEPSPNKGNPIRSARGANEPQDSHSSDNTPTQVEPGSPLSQAVRSGQTNRVQEEVARILKSNPDDVTALNTLAMWNFRQGKVGAAKLLLSRAIQKGKPNASILNNYGLMLLGEGDELGAVEQFKKALQLNDEHSEANANLGSYYAKGGDWKRALPRLELAYKLGRTDSAVVNNLALAYKNQNEISQAEKYLQEALKKDSKNVTIILNLAELLIVNLNRPKEGLPLVYKAKLLETQRKDVLAKASELERLASARIGGDNSSKSESH